MTTFTPYLHQTNALEESWTALQSGERPLVILPTGAGKTAYAAMMATECNGRVLIICCMIPLISQFHEDLLMVGVDDHTIGILQGDNSDSLEYLSRCRVVIAMAQTLQEERGAQFLRENRFDMSIGDERHIAHIRHAEALVAATYKIGMTATPLTADGDEELESFTWVQTTSLVELIEGDKLIDYNHYYYPDEFDEDVFVDPAYVFTEWIKCLRGVPTLGFCRSIEDAKEYAAYFTGKGFPCDTACDDTPLEEFEQSRADLRSGRVHIIWSVYKTRTGFNEPCAKGLLACCRVNSVVAWVQMIGRIVRRDGINKPGLLLDFFNNGKRLPDPRDIYDWCDLPGPSGKACKSCGRKNSNKLYYCKGCGECLAGPEEILRIRKSVACAMADKGIRLHKPLQVEERSSDRLDQIGVTRVARAAAFWQHQEDPIFAVRKQQELFPKMPEIVHSKLLEGAIFGGEMSAEQLGAYLVYLKKYADKRSEPDNWVMAEVRTEGGQAAVDMLRLVVAA
jgi:superfamily II DNA or RNA helicase